jgi:hypothetical protein
MEDNAVVDSGVRPIPSGDCVFALPALEVDERHLVLDGERLHSLNESVVQRVEQRR